MEPSGFCPSCNQPLPADTPLGGLCPACLIKSGFYSGTAPRQDKREKFAAPVVGDLAPHFPHLEIIDLIGRGGMGAVYKARQPKLNRLVALKILAREPATDARFAERFQREAQALARMNHPNIVTVYDFGEAGGHFYLLMEYVEGLNLRQIEHGNKITPEEALAIVPPICDALQYAHSHGIVHRDIKPENILLDTEGRVKIADFGIAKILGTDTALEEPLTDDEQRVGTPHYMAPEQVEKPNTVDHRADIYSLGVVFYEMLTGELPLGRFAPPSKKVQIDVRLDEIVLRALEKEPELRYQQASEIRTQVETLTPSQSRNAQSGQATPTAIPAVPQPDKASQLMGAIVMLVMLILGHKIVQGSALIFWYFGLGIGLVSILCWLIKASFPRNQTGSLIPWKIWEVVAKLVSATFYPGARLSRTAITGAIWAALLPGTILIAMVAYRNISPADTGLLTLYNFVGSIGKSTIIGTTILGFVAIRQIHRSSGSLYGLGLAVFDVLLFPLIALAGASFWLTTRLLQAYVKYYAKGGRQPDDFILQFYHEIKIVLTGLVFWEISRHIVRFVMRWAFANGTANAHTMSASPFNDTTSPATISAYLEIAVYTFTTFWALVNFTLNLNEIYHNGSSERALFGLLWGVTGVITAIAIIWRIRKYPTSRAGLTTTVALFAAGALAVWLVKPHARDVNSTTVPQTTTLSGTAAIQQVNSTPNLKLIAVSDGKNTPRVWTTHGILLEGLPGGFEKRTAFVYPGPDHVERVFYLTLGNVSQNLSFTHEILFSASTALQSMRQGENEFITLAASLPDNLREATLKIGISSGKWEQVASPPIATSSASSGSFSERNTSYSLTTTIHDLSDGALKVTVAFNLSKEFQARLILIDKNGKLHIGKSITSSSTGDIHQRTYTFDKITTNSEIRRLEFQASPYIMYEFKNVQLYPESSVTKVASKAESVRTSRPMAKANSATSTPYTWQSTNPYQPPDFEAYFPDDTDGASKLEALWDSPDKDSRSDKEILDTVRAGLRRLRVDRRMPVLRWIGNKYIWGKDPQNLRAIEIMYHAAETHPGNLDPYNTRGPAIYFGLSVVKKKTPAILHTLTDIAMLVDDPNDLDRIAWGTESQRHEMMTYLQPYLESHDQATGEKAEIIRKILTGELKAFAWATERARTRAQADYSDQLPSLRSSLTSGTSQARMDALRFILREQLALIMDETFIPAFAAAGTDPDPRVRREVARTAGERWVWSIDTQSTAAIDLMLKLSKDEDRQVRYNAVYFGLSTIRHKSNAVIRRLLELAIEDPEPNNYRRIVWGLKTNPDDTKRLIQMLIKNAGDGANAAAAQKLLQDITGED